VCQRGENCRALGAKRPEDLGRGRNAAYPPVVEAWPEAGHDRLALHAQTCLVDESGGDLALSILVRKLLRRDNFRSIDDLRTQVLALIDYFNRTVAKPLLMDLPGTATSCLTRRSRPDQGRAVLGLLP
jgi:hypothetical protein